MKKLTAPRTTQQRPHYDTLPALRQEAADRRMWTGCTGGEFSLDCPFCWSPEPSRQRITAADLY
ncbi:hypothetical protein [Arthrobacter sp. 4R501]|uniref:hypothetical protein n=1 Tax=Arthrobacter sp. 4R501 TaxID=2058886 RepID=UPI000CE3FBE5|nr:hypothetical protein [Arthrobacter sp. 4R501]